MINFINVVMITAFYGKAEAISQLEFEEELKTKIRGFLAKTNPSVVRESDMELTISVMSTYADYCYENSSLLCKFYKGSLTVTERMELKEGFETIIEIFGYSIQRLAYYRNQLQHTLKTLKEAVQRDFNRIKKSGYGRKREMGKRMVRKRSKRERSKGKKRETSKGGEG
eukprot:GHVP01050501.1.p1 GENE.GHVP01050501.1~~GHVP01050501.1.p1  ORF type:complete len:169 (+),score=25.61 GHVP01050501.1:471-977(+)